MLHQLEDFYLNQEEPNRSYYLALHDVIMNCDGDVTAHWKYKLPFFYYKNKPFCYFWYDKKTNEPYIGIVKGNQIEHPMLEQGDRKKMKILRLNPCADIPVDMLYTLLKRLIELY